MVNRENSHDAIALGMHDTANRLGADFRIDGEHFDADLLPVLRFIMRHHNLAEGNYSFTLDGEGPDDEALDRLLADFERQHASLRLYGDDLLRQHPRQQLLMLLLQVRGLLDVLDRCEGLCGRNSLNEFIWHEYDERTPELPPRAGIRHGEYVLDASQLSQSSDVFILSVGGEAPLSEFGSSRLVVSTELVPLRFIGASEFLRQHTVNRPISECEVLSLCNIAPVFGATMIEDERFTAWGPNVRIIKAFPRIDLQLSAYWQYLKYELEHDRDARKGTWGVRLDTGFSLYTAFIGVGKGYFVGEHGQRLDSDYVVSFGMAFGFPLSRLGLPW
jgi:hypothetical protein